MVIRSCIPLVTLLLQQLAHRLQLVTVSKATVWDALLMSLGVAGAALTAVAESEAKEQVKGNLWMGALDFSACHIHFTSMMLFMVFVIYDDI